VVDEALQSRDCIVEIGGLHFPETSAQQTLMAPPLRGPYVAGSEDGVLRPILQRTIYREAVNGCRSAVFEVMLAVQEDNVIHNASRRG
jgi:hypothetical protein